MSHTHLYEVSLDWQSDRKGIMYSDILNDKIEVATPPEFPKGMPGIWSPEHLLVAAVNSCLMTTFLAIAENSKLEYLQFHSRAIGKLEQVEGKWLISEITLYPRVLIHNEHDRERAERILQKSEAACLISNSIKAKILMETHVETAVPA
ncbi:MAG TPA: OsmC family protein [Chitinophagaceae bacterium]|nr:OsmC family protein [Chitinophagaceae bacterium]